MKKKRSLPESLDLLLDTMCNTFGGIMFIAISLIVMLQAVSKSMQKTTDEELSRQIQNRLQMQIRILQQEIMSIENRIETEKLKRMPVTRERKELIRQMLEVQKREKELLTQIEHSAIKAAVLQEKQKRLRKEISSYTEKLQQKEDKYIDNYLETNELHKAYQKKIKALKTQLRQLRVQTFRFAADEQTFQTPYIVLVSSGKIYLYGYNLIYSATEDVKCIKAGNYMRLIPEKGKGTTLSMNPERTLDWLFRSVDRNVYFIYLSSDLESYSALLTVRRYLRNKGYKVFLNINPHFIYSLSSSVRYQASQ